MTVSPRARLRAIIAALVSLALPGAILVGTSTPAAAATLSDPTYNVVDRPAGTVTADALPTVQIDGVVWDTVIAGSTVYAGGQFANARPAGAAAGTNLTARNNLLSFNLQSGVLNTGFNPDVNGRVRSMTLSPDKKTLYVVGAFTKVGSVARYRVAAFNTADGSLITSFAPVAGSDVFAVAATDSAVYLGGWFTSMNGVARQRLAAVNPKTGATLGWAPTADSTVNTMTLSSDGSRVVVGGIFANLNGTSAPGLGSFDAGNGTMYPFAANEVIRNYGNSAGILSLKANGSDVYGTAYWFGGTGTFEGMFVADAATGTIKSLADCHGDTYDATATNGLIYTVSHHHDCSNINGFPDTNPRNRWKRANAFTYDATTTVGPNTAGGYGDFRGQPAPALVNWFPDVTVGTYTGQSQGGWTTESTNDYVIEGGEFPTVNNTAQQGLVRFATPSLATNKSGPRVSSASSAPTLRGISGDSVRVAWPSNWDRDDITLTYKLYRSDRSSTPLYTGTKVSEFWNLPTQVFTDTGLKPNTSYGYWVTAADASGNIVKSTTTTITTGTNTVDNSAYAQAVTNDGASHYWRFNDPAGSSTAIDWVSANDMVLGSGVVSGSTGAVNGSPDTAATFDGTGNGTAGSTSTEVGANMFSAEAWFKTTSTSGGKVLGFGDSQLGNSSNYDRHIWLDNDGRLKAGVNGNGLRVASAGAGYNDGSWHQAVMTVASNGGGLKLYVDGLLEGQDDGAVGAQPFSGYWRVGGDNLGGWPASVSSNDLAATIDDVSTYPSVLTTAQIQNHFVKSGRTLNLPNEPTDAYGKKIYNADPALYWRFDDAASATEVADASQNRNKGIASNGVAFGAASDVAPGSAAAFDGNDDTIASVRSYSNPHNYSEELWFQTTTTRGGKLIGFGNTQSGNSGNYDRHVYMEDSGQLTDGTYTGQLNTITSPRAYNDGQWHHLVATQSTEDGMRLYVDGSLVGTNPQTDAQGYDGYWRVGGDSSWGGSSNYFNGSIDEAAVYLRVLNADEVRAHYRASAAASNAAPLASFTQSCTDTACYVDGSGSSDPDGTVASYAWDFGDGGTASTATAPHTYARAGTFSIKLTVTDDGGKATTVSQQVTVTAPNQVPSAAFVSTCTNLDCTFDGSASADADGTLSSYVWDFGDGASATGATVAHTFTSGTHTVTLVVTDDRDGKASVSHDVTVQPANASPVAAFSFSVSSQTVVFDSSASKDPNGTIATYQWDFGDGSGSSTANPTHTYTDAGDYVVTLTLTDNQGGTGSANKTVTTTRAPNVAPTASFTSSQSALKVSVDGSASSDPDGSVTAYTWSYGDASTGSGKTDAHTYSTAGTYTVTLTVTDNNGATGVTTKSVTVAAAPANQKPSSSFSSTVSDLRVSVDASASADPDGTVAGYAWSYGDGGTGSGRTDAHTYASAGTYTVTLEVTDDEGATDTSSKSVTVAAAPVSPVVAADAFGRNAAKWGTADTGGTWSDSGASYFASDGSKGLITVSKAGSGPVASLNSVSVLNSTSTAEFSLDKVANGGGYYFGIGARKQGTSEYRLKVRVLADGSVHLLTTRTVSGTETTLKESVVGGLTYQSGDTLKVRFDVSGTGTATLSGKVWKASGTEPATAQVTSTDSTSALQGAGAVEVQGYLSGSSTNFPVVASVDNLKVVRN